MSGNPKVTFQTDFFKPMVGEEEETNPREDGKALASWSADQLRERGVSVEGVIPEDFGWVIMVSRAPSMRWIGSGNTDGSIAEWSVFPAAEPATIQRIFKRVNPAPEIEAPCLHLAELVPSIPGVSNVTWEYHAAQQPIHQL